jgi:hypothetical protein
MPSARRVQLRRRRRTRPTAGCVVCVRAGCAGAARRRRPKHPAALARRRGHRCRPCAACAPEAPYPRRSARRAQQPRGTAAGEAQCNKLKRRQCAPTRALCLLQHRNALPVQRLTLGWRTISLASTSAPCSSSRRAFSRWPRCATACSGVQPCCASPPRYSARRRQWHAWSAARDSGATLPMQNGSRAAPDTRPHARMPTARGVQLRPTAGCVVCVLRCSRTAQTKTRCTLQAPRPSALLVCRVLRLRRHTRGSARRAQQPRGKAAGKALNES